METWKWIAIGVTFWCVVVYLVCRRLYTHPSVPICYGEMPPNPQHQAEYDCHHCKFNGTCLVETMKIRP